MQITDLKVTLIRWKVEPWRTATMHFGGETKLGILAVETDEGITGYGFLSGGDIRAMQAVRLKPQLIGRNPLDIGAIWQSLWPSHRGIHLSVIGAIDVALWDIAGKAAGMPIHQLLGTCKHEVPAYASADWFETAEEFAEEALRFQSEGWTAYKIHPHAVPKSDIDICQKVRAAVGDEMVLMLDSMWSYCYEDALRVGRAIEELDFFWYEDPLQEEDIYNYTKLKQKLDIPMINTEFAPGGFYGMAQWITSQATDMLRGDVAVCGGITPMVRIAHLAEGFHMKCEIHHGGNSIMNYANLHVTMGIPNCDYFEVFPCSGAFKYGLVEDIEVDSNGMVHAPTAPGLGCEIDWDLVEREKIDVVT
tara:strand:+ start:100 stop:1185 length:1086 start_codon:yes stop_codon:yes gene_type:complete